MDAIIPAAGLASRMRGIPKFLLPCDSLYTTLIEQHIESLLSVCETIWIPTRPEMVLLLDSLGLAKDRIVILPVQTENMTQTIGKVLKISSSSYFFMAMPDTYFSGEKPYKRLNNSPEIADLACWKIRTEQKGKLGQVLIEKNLIKDVQDKNPNCEYIYSWGALTFSKKLLEYSSELDPHIGFAIKKAVFAGESITGEIINGNYYDCGTPAEYLSLLKSEL
jgi:choline kinase